MKPNPREQGQISILLALVVVGLLAFSALAIDGGLLLTDRRRAQNAADNAALAAAGKLAAMLYTDEVSTSTLNCSNLPTKYKNPAIAAANTVASNNGFTISTPTFKCTTSGPKGVLVGVSLTAQTQAVLSQVVYSGDLENTVVAEARVVSTAGPLLPGLAIVALDKNEKKALDGSGNTDVTINNSGYWSNGGLECPTAGGIKVVNGSGGALGPISNKKNGCTPAPATTGDEIEKFDVPEIKCSDLTPRNDSGSNLEPGCYNGIKLTNKDTKTLKPGLYYLKGELSVQGGKLTAMGVTIISEGGWKINGGTVNMEPATTDADGAIPGLLFYTASSGTGIITINGNGNVGLSGTVYVPNGNIKINGTSNSTGWYTQFIGDTVDLSGTSGLTINYDQNKIFKGVTVVLDVTQ